MVKISQTDRVRNEEVLQRVKNDRNVLNTTNRRKANWIGDICVGIAFQNTLLKEEVKGRRERRRKQLLDDLKETKGYCTLKEEALCG